jgi:hypothetical protein
MTKIRNLALLLALLAQIDCTTQGNAQPGSAIRIDSVSRVIPRKNLQLHPVNETLTPPSSVMQYPPQEVP